ncbi:1,4-alpha-glucan branching protein GlgB [Paenibacillus thailandensis]|uniref:1,4-alpha-glucan branching enzyme GlgB n=1 Tax=Paenibacillus thailandensis TaxID=393250 RepID=A0ABW5QQL4_9BACL
MLTSTRIQEEWSKFHEGTLYDSYDWMGAHLVTEEGREGVRFTVWAPHAREVRLVSDFNGWEEGMGIPLQRLTETGIWSLFVPGLPEGTIYKYEIVSAAGERLLKADPYAFYCEVKPRTASVVKSIEGYGWRDAAWLKRRKPPYAGPVNIYEVHLGSWKRHEDGSYYSYAELAAELVPYVKHMGYTHIELLPLTEHPYDRSWGYQVTGFFAATSRFGTPQDLMHLIDECHANGIGVLLDWVPAHFVKDAHGLRQFDGSPLYEHEDPLIAEKPGWGTLGFDYGKPEICSFLISSALFWLDKYHVDGLRVDAVTSMLLRSFDKSAWRPNPGGGQEDTDAIAFLRKLNETVFAKFPNAMMIAEESSAWPGVTMPASEGGLGFNYKWNMGWMNDTLKYAELDPICRAANQSLLTFPVVYAYSENYVLPLSHDEAVHGKKSLLNKMPGTYEQKFAGLRLLIGYMMAFPGKKLLFMGGEFGQYDEWKDESQLDWMVLEFEMHRRMHRYTRDINHLYLRHKALWQRDHDWRGHEWIDHQDHIQNVICFIRKGNAKDEQLIAVCHFSPVRREKYRIGVPSSGRYRIVLNSDDPEYGGEGHIASDELLKAERKPWHNAAYSIELTLPPLAVLWLKREKASRKPAAKKASGSAAGPAGQEAEAHEQQAGRSTRRTRQKPASAGKEAPAGQRAKRPANGSRTGV